MDDKFMDYFVIVKYTQTDYSYFPSSKILVGPPSTRYKVYRMRITCSLLKVTSSKNVLNYWIILIIPMLVDLVQIIIFVFMGNIYQ